MELKVCEFCGSMNTSEDLMTKDHKCLVCGNISKGRNIDFYGIRPNERIIKHSPRFQPFKIQQKIKIYLNEL